MAETSTTATATATPFTHLGMYDVRPNGRKRLTECNVWVDRDACVRLDAVTCPACKIIIERRNAETEAMAAGFGMRLVDGVLVLMEEGQ